MGLTELWGEDDRLTGERQMEGRQAGSEILLFRQMLRAASVGRLILAVHLLYKYTLVCATWMEPSPKHRELL